MLIRIRIHAVDGPIPDFLFSACDVSVDAKKKELIGA